MRLFRHYKSPSFHSVIRIHLISLSYHILVILPSHFSSMEQMLMLMLMKISRLEEFEACTIENRIAVQRCKQCFHFGYIVCLIHKILKIVYSTRNKKD